MAVKIGRMVLGSVQTNCYFVYQEGKNQVLLFDPADNADYIVQALQEKDFTIAAILLTHGHFDHIWGCNQLRELTGAKVYALDKEQELLENATLNVSEMAGRAYTVKADEFLTDGQTIELGDITMQVIATPGHTQGGCCYYLKEDGLLIAGDTVFEGSVGRTDLPTGSGSVLKRTIQDKLTVLPDETRVFPGHGGFTTIGDEKKYNPFF